MVYFITGNENKFREAKAVLPDLEWLDVDLTEIQSVNPEEIIRSKLLEASAHHAGAFVVEDSSLCLECLNGLPGPLIKWFEKTLGLEKIVEITEKLNNDKATAKVVIGYKQGDKIEFFEGAMQGKIVRPHGEKDFGWGPIFQPDGYNRTFGQMDREEKNAISMRKIAFEKLRNHLESNR